MIENFSDFLSAIIIVLVPLLVFILVIRASVRSVGGQRKASEEKQIEYFKEW